MHRDDSITLATHGRRTDTVAGVTDVHHRLQRRRETHDLHEDDAWTKHGAEEALRGQRLDPRHRFA
jgi:hypothetical protein